jgi:hypothetical protein
LSREHRRPLKRARRTADTYRVTDLRPAAVVPRTQSPAPTTSPRAVVRYALIGTLLAVMLLVMDVSGSGQGIARTLQPGQSGPSVDLIRRDFPGTGIGEGLGLDGQQFYAMARDPWHPDKVAPYLDNARYRYQRPLLPVLAWVLHPGGGGPGLAIALVVVNLAGIFGGAIALGFLSRQLRGPRWLGALFPLLPGALWALFTSVADGLAVGLCLATIALVLRGRTRWAVLAAVAAVLTRETTILVPLALVLAQRRRSTLPVLVVPAVVVAAWLVVVHLWVPAVGTPPEHLVLPFTGLIGAARRWLQGEQLIGMVSTLSAFALGTVVLVRRRGPLELRAVVAVQLGFLAFASYNVLGTDFGGTRSTLTLLAVACACLLCRTVAGESAEARPSPA